MQVKPVSGDRTTQGKLFSLAFFGVGDWGLVDLGYENMRIGFIFLRQGVSGYLFTL